MFSPLAYCPYVIPYTAVIAGVNRPAGNETEEFVRTTTFVLCLHVPGGNEKRNTVTLARSRSRVKRNGAEEYDGK